MRVSREVQVSARGLIAQRLGLHFPEHREEDLARRLVRACQASRASDVGRYLSMLATLPDDSPEWRRFASHLTVGETYFFRDRRCFDALEQEVFPSLIERRRREGIPRLRIWSAGCASGEEPYSLAILIDRLLPDRADWSVTLLATDVNPRALAAAQRALYREWSLRDTPEWIRQRYFLPHGPATFELAAAIRRMVTFAPLNLAEGTYPSLATNTSAIDLILCRNVVMYFTREAQNAAFGRFHEALVDGGWLVVSPAEASAQLLRPLEPVNFPGSILFRKNARSRERLAAAQPGGTVPPSRPAAQARPPRRPLRSAPVSVREPDQARDGARVLGLAAEEADRGSLDRARDLCLEAVSGGRLNPDAYLLLAAVQQERGDLTAAVDAIRRAIYLAPDSPSAHFILGSLLSRQGQRTKARRSMETVVSLLDSAPSDQAVPGADGLTAGRLLETARAYLEAQ
jgi:chemotaxis protein methyltransferase CheR